MPSAAAGIEADTTGIGIPTSGISVRYQTGSVIGIFVLFGFGLPALKKPFPRYALHVQYCLWSKGLLLHVVVHTASGGNEYILQVHRRLLPVLFWL
jgi:hypothetical protein